METQGYTSNLAPAKKAEKVTELDSTAIATAEDVSLSNGTSFIEVHAVDGRVVLRYDEEATATEYDELITPASPRQYALNDALEGTDKVSVLAKDEGASVILIEK